MYVRGSGGKWVSYIRSLSEWVSEQEKRVLLKEYLVKQGTGTRGEP